VGLLERLEDLVGLGLVGARVELLELLGHGLKEGVHSDAGEAHGDGLGEEGH
jgi:hypothetical protein